MADIHEIGVPDGQTRLDLPVEQVLRSALDRGLTEVTIIGRNGEEFYLATSIGDQYKTYFWLDFAKVFLREQE